MEEQVIESTLNGFKADYVCDKCKHTQQVNVFPCINFNKNPEYYALVKDMTIFKVKCEQCGVEKVIQFDTLLIDETHKYFLYLLTDKSLYSKFRHQIKYFIETVLNKNDQYDMSEYKTRLVFQPNDLIEKINIFECGLNDEVIEVIKVGFYDKNLINRNIYDCVYFDGIMNNGNLEFVAFSSKTTTKEPMKYVIDHKLYNKILEDLHNFENRHHPYFEVIDEEWVRSKFDKKDGKTEEEHTEA